MSILFRTDFKEASAEAVDADGTSWTAVESAVAGGHTELAEVIQSCLSLVSRDDPQIGTAPADAGKGSNAVGSEGKGSNDAWSGDEDKGGKGMMGEGIKGKG